MTPNTRRIIIVVAAIQIVAAAILLAMPRIVQAIPVPYREALAERSRLAADVMELVTTPYPTLAAPSGVTVQEVVIPALPAERIELASASPAELITDDARPTATPASTALEGAPAAGQVVATAGPTTPATPAPTAVPTVQPTLAPPPPSASISGLTVEPQKFNNCGPANMTIVLNYFGVDINQVQAAEYLKPNEQDRNVSPWQMVDYVNEQIPGMRAAAFSGGDLDMLRALIAAGFPVIIEKGYDPGRDEGWYGHYLTVHSYDDAGLIFSSKDTYLGPFDGGDRIDSYREIATAWQEFNYTFIVIFRPGDEALVNRILGPEMVEPLRMWERAARVAQAETEADPEDNFAWFNLGTSLTRLGELTGDRAFYEQGAAAFDRALSLGLPGRMLWYQFRIFIAYMKLGRYQDMVDLVDGMLTSPDPRVNVGAKYVEELYLYKGHALAFLGNIAGARASYQAGLELNPNSYPIQWALDSLP